MKKYTFIILCFSILQLTVIQKAHATAAIGATFPQQIVQTVEEISTNTASVRSAIADAQQAYNSGIGANIGRALGTAAQQAIANETINWVAGGTSGNPSLMVPNAEKFLAGEVNKKAKIALGSLSQGALAGTIFGSMLYEYQTKNKSLEAQIKEAVHTNTPTIIQNDFCGDDNLTDIATQDVQDEDGNVDSLELANRRSELYEEYCAEDPEDNQELAENLVTMADLNKELALGGFDRLLETTVGGSNPTATKDRVVTRTSSAAAKAEELAKNKLFQGEKTLSQTECLQKEPSVDTVYLRDDNGDLVFDSRNEPIPDPSVATTNGCKEGQDIVVTSGETVQSALNNAANSGLDRLTALQDGGLTGLLTTLAIQRLTSGINKTIKSTVNDIRSSVTGKTTSNVGVVSTKTVAFQQDLKGDEETKASILSPMIKQIQYYQDELANLTTIDTSYLNAVNAYEPRLATGRLCYESLVNDNLFSTQDAQIAHATDFYDKRQQQVDSVKNTLTQELQKITAAKNLAANTLSTINSSNSTQEITKTFTTYNNTVDSRGYPNPQTAGQREGEYIKNKTDMESDFKDIPNNSEIRENAKTMEAACNQLRNSRNYNGGNYGG